MQNHYDPDILVPQQSLNKTHRFCKSFLNDKICQGIKHYNCFCAAWNGYQLLIQYAKTIRFIDRTNIAWQCFDIIFAIELTKFPTARIFKAADELNMWILIRF
mmetsp:Transcript_66022/g.176904  ORF Transcript_66022/g.176904 Transcript_66022/m.176904 type:complete len:103 (-) Transcript_66022:156-464(-)